MMLLIPLNPNSNKAVHNIRTKMVHKQLELDYELGYYSDSSVPSAPGLLDLHRHQANKIL